IILGISAIGSAFIENIVFVAAFMPVVVKLEDTVLLWALLHGACLGGNITMIGSTANIAAVGMLEKRYWTLINFFTWLRTGLAVGVISCLVAWIGLAIMSPHMPNRDERLRSAQITSLQQGREGERRAVGPAQ
ncbi:MAG: anion permease, partial [Planctomycetes bacterium]|nr:anion permease [Planctomycetota bacterium]